MKIATLPGSGRIRTRIRQMIHKGHMLPDLLVVHSKLYGRTHRIRKNPPGKQHAIEGFLVWPLGVILDRKLRHSSIPPL
jgi:hypothetical protein